MKTLCFPMQLDSPPCRPTTWRLRVAPQKLPHFHGLTQRSAGGPWLQRVVEGSMCLRNPFHKLATIYPIRSGCCWWFTSQKLCPFARVNLPSELPRANRPHQTWQWTSHQSPKEFQRSFQSDPALIVGFHHTEEWQLPASLTLQSLTSPERLWDLNVDCIFASSEAKMLEPLRGTSRFKKRLFRSSNERVTHLAPTPPTLRRQCSGSIAGTGWWCLMNLVTTLSVGTNLTTVVPGRSTGH